MQHIFFSRNSVLLYIVLTSLFFLELFLGLLGNGQSALNLRLSLFLIVSLPFLLMLVSSLREHELEASFSIKKAKSIYIFFGSIILAALMYLAGFALYYSFGILLLVFGMTWLRLSYISASFALLSFIVTIYFVVFGDAALAESSSLYAYYFLLFSVVAQIGNLILYPKSLDNAA